MKPSSKVRTAVGIVTLVLCGIAFSRYAERPEHHAIAASSSLKTGSFMVGSLNRSYIAFIPPHLPSNSPLLIVLHGAGENAQGIRKATADEFESLASADKFAVVYPNGYLGNWNDCRAAASFPAHTKNVNDVAFVSDLITNLHAHYGTSANRVFATGYSNGGQMAYRLALEVPQKISGIATIAANLPTPQNNDCHLSGSPVPTLIITGTKDPIDPYSGGIESLFGRQSRGTVLSSLATTQYFTKLDGQTEPPVSTLLPHFNTSGKTYVTQNVYDTPGQPEVAEYVVTGGGHVIPDSYHAWPRSLGSSTHDIDAPQVIWNFFSKLSS